MNASPIPWEVYFKVNKNKNNPTFHLQKATTITSTLCTKTQRTYLKLQEKLSDNMPTSAQVEAETVFSYPGITVNLLLAQLPILHHHKPQNICYMTKKCCNSVRAILPTLGSKKAKQESPL